MTEPKSSTQPKAPLRILQPNVSPVEIGKYYLDVALTKLNEEELHSPEHANLEAEISAMQESQMWRLVEAFSKTCGLNDVFSFLTNESYNWQKEEWRINDLNLTGMGPQIDAIIHHGTVQRKPREMGRYLQQYFATHPHDDPEHLNELRPRNTPIRFPIILLREDSKREPALLDGSHRLIEMIQQGQKTVVAYMGRGDKNARTALGPSLFRTLQQQYAKTGDPAILEATKLFMTTSTDGRKWVRTYWIDHIRDQKIQEAGRTLLGDD